MQFKLSYFKTGASNRFVNAEGNFPLNAQKSRPNENGSRLKISIHYFQKVMILSRISIILQIRYSDIRRSSPSPTNSVRRADAILKETIIFFMENFFITFSIDLHGRASIGGFSTRWRALIKVSSNPITSLSSAVLLPRLTSSNRSCKGRWTR